MNNAGWILLDTETTGFAAPVFVVEIGAQRMRGWEPDGEPFRKLLNQDCKIPPEASRVHGYTREILERDGEPAVEVYEAFREYAGVCPMVAYNTEYDLDRVLRPEWTRLGIAPIGSAGFCALRLAQRLLDPVPAGNLATLRQYYCLPKREGPVALECVLTLVDMFGRVFRPIAERRGLDTWDKLVNYAGEEWYPSRIGFGPHKGKPVWSARDDEELRAWLELLARSTNTRSAEMGRWYFRRVDTAEPEGDLIGVVDVSETRDGGTIRESTAIVVFEHPEVPKLRALVEAARARLAELEAAYTVEKSKVDGLQARLFSRLRPLHQERERLRLVVSYRRQFLDTLLRQDEEEAEKVERQYHEAKSASDREYEETAAAMAAKKELSGEEEAELKKLWKRLVNLYHPDRFSHEPDKLETYHKLTAAINHAKDNGDFDTLRQIASDANDFILRQGWASLDFRDEQQLAQLRKLWESLELEIVNVIEAMNRLRESPEFELHELIANDSEMFERVVERQSGQLKDEIGELKRRAEEFGEEIEELTGRSAPA